MPKLAQPSSRDSPSFLNRELTTDLPVHVIIATLQRYFLSDPFTLALLKVTPYRNDRSNTPQTRCVKNAPHRRRDDPLAATDSFPGTIRYHEPAPAVAHSREHEAINSAGTEKRGQHGYRRLKGLPRCSDPRAIPRALNAMCLTT